MIDNAFGCRLGEQFVREPKKMQVWPTPSFEENRLTCALG